MIWTLPCLLVGAGIAALGAAFDVAALGYLGWGLMLPAAILAAGGVLGAFSQTIGRLP